MLRGNVLSLGSLSNGVFERRTSTGSEVFFILKHLDAPKFVFLSVLTIIETSCPKKWAKPLSKNEKKPLPVDVRRSKTSLLKFTIYVIETFSGFLKLFRTLGPQASCVISSSL